MDLKAEHKRWIVLLAISAFILMPVLPHADADSSPEFSDDTTSSLTAYLGSSATEGNEISGSIVVVSGTAVEITLISSNSATEDISYTLYSTGDTGTIDETANNDGSETYSFTVTGTGCFRIIATASYTADSVTYEDSCSFYVYAMPSFENISAAITVSSS